MRVERKVKRDKYDSKVRPKARKGAAVRLH
jgi:hypothetical protein